MDMPLVHDLIEIRTGSVAPGCLAKPDWVERSLEQNAWVVVRRGKTAAGRIAVGVRGCARNQRWGGFLQQEQIKRVLAPIGLRSQDVSETRLGLPAFRALQVLEQELTGFDLCWGPGGSVGFEVATGRPSTGVASDLDLVVRCPAHLDRAEAMELLEVTSRAPGRVDVRIETPVGGFALEEYCRSATGSIMVRTSTGSLLLQDLWEIPQL